MCIDPRYEFHLPLVFNDGSPIPTELFTQVCDELIGKFGGFHVLSPGSPAKGYWKSGSVLYRDDILIYRITTLQDEDDFFKEYKGELAQRFAQEEIFVEKEETYRL